MLFLRFEPVLVSTFVRDPWGPLGWVQKSWRFAEGCFVWGFFSRETASEGRAKVGDFALFGRRLFCGSWRENWVIKELGAGYDSGGSRRGKRGVFLAGGSGESLKRFLTRMALPVGMKGVTSGGGD